MILWLHDGLYIGGDLIVDSILAIQPISGDSWTFKYLQMNGLFYMIRLGTTAPGEKRPRAGAISQVDGLMEVRYRDFLDTLPQEPMKNVRVYEVVTIVIAATMIVAHSLWTFEWVVDDAFITLRYAENFSRGLGPVFNPDERVEGYTCFLWMVLLSGVHRLPLDPYIGMKVMSMLSAMGTIVLVTFSHRFTSAISPRAAVVAALFCTTSIAFLQWASGAMENVLFAGLVLAMILAYLHVLEAKGATRGWILLVAVFGALSVMTRPNGIVFVGVLGIHRIITDIRTGQRVSWLLAGAFAVLYGVYFAWRWQYFGWLLPNTFYAKVGDNIEQAYRGVRYVNEALADTVFLAAPALTWLLLGSQDTVQDRAGRVIGLCVVGHLAFVIAVGGDNFAVHRFFTVIVPLLALLAGQCFDRFAHDKRQFAIASLTLLVFNVGMLRAHSDYKSVRNAHHSVATKGREVGEFLHDHAPAGTLLATNAAGAVAYYSKLKIVDTLGLNDETIAHTYIKSMGKGKAGHEKGNGKYVLGRKPDYVLFASSNGAKKPMFRGDKELARRKGFKKNYVFERYRLPSGRTLSMYRRKNAPPLDVAPL